MHCDKLTLLAMTTTRDVAIDGKSINVCSAIEWLLKQE